jgi:hypothetical protein
MSKTVCHYQFLFGSMVCDVSVSFHFQNNRKPLEELKVSTVQDGVTKEFPALVNIFAEYIRNESVIF